jgi:ribosome-binding factor A
MSFRVKQINEMLLSELAMLVSENVIFKDGLITLTAVDTSPDLRQAKITISVLPESQTGSALKELRKHNSEFNKILKQRLRLKFVPKFFWNIDEKIMHMLEIDEVLKQIEAEAKE